MRRFDGAESRLRLRPRLEHYRNRRQSDRRAQPNLRLRQSEPRDLGHGPFGTNTYAYDSVGNRTQRTVTVPFAATETYTNAATSNRLTSISGAVNRGRSIEFQTGLRAPLSLVQLVRPWQVPKRTLQVPNVSAGIKNE
jgi:hypothetical protein